MVYLGGPRKRRGAGPKGLYLHDPPPGYQPPAPQISEKDLQRKVRQDWILMRATTVILVLTAFAFILIITAIIATHLARHRHRPRPRPRPSPAARAKRSAPTDQ